MHFPKGKPDFLKAVLFLAFSYQNLFHINNSHSHLFLLFHLLLFLILHLLFYYAHLLISIIPKGEGAEPLREFNHESFSTARSYHRLESIHELG